jgi:penicillin amidase
VVLREYVAGVNAGLRELKTPPFEYGFLFTAPQPWTEEDSLLVNMAMYMMLQENKGVHPEAVRQKLVQEYGTQFADFIQATRSEWDAPMQETEPRLVQSLPSRLTAPRPLAAIKPVAGPRLAMAGEIRDAGESIIGSNSWVVSGRKTADGRAVLANDMHLPLQQPNTFYHVTIKSADLDHVIAGVSVPGLPALVAGSNGHIAWGLTNSNGDWSDLVRIRKDRLAAETTTVRETIKVKGGKPVFVDVRDTRWGPIVTDDSQYGYALDWVAQHAEGNNLGLFPLIRTASIEGGLGVAAAAGMAHMNIVFADDHGKAAWTIAGRIPRRTGFAGDQPAEWSDTIGWTGWLDAQAYPVLTSDQRDFVWTANNRVVSGSEWQKIGVGSQFALGVRARRIEERLAQSSGVGEKEMHALQLDDTALLMTRWHGLLGNVIAGMPDSPEKNELSSVMATWNGKAGADSAAYRIMRRFREEVASDVMPAVLADLLRKDASLKWYTVAPQWETPLWQILSQRPAAALPAGYADWDAYLRTTLTNRVYKPYKDMYKGDLKQATWGAINVARIRHPLSAAVPFLGKLLDMPKASMNGDSNVVLAQYESFGPAVRLVVSPGHESEAILTMPAGEAGNPLSPYYGRGHKEWQQGLTLPLLSGEPRYVLHLQPPPH